MKTICYIAHELLAQSSSQQFLLQSGKMMETVDYVDLTNDPIAFDCQMEAQRIKEYDQIIFQFPLYWYQAPAILKRWIDEVWTYFPNHLLKNKMLGIVVVVGNKAEHFQLGAKYGRTVMDLLIPYRLLATSFQMAFKAPMIVHQFQYMPEHQKKQLMWRYLFYVTHLENESFSLYQRFLMTQAEKSVTRAITMDDQQWMLWELFRQQLEDQADEVDELMALTKEWQ